MSRRVGSLLLGGLLALGASASQGELLFKARLTGAQQVPDPVQTSTRGIAKFLFAPDFSRMAFRLRFRNGNGITAVQLQCGPAGAIGPVVAPLFGPITGGLFGNVNLSASLTDANIRLDSGCRSIIGQSVSSLFDLAEAMSSGGIYVNVQSIAFPGFSESAISEGEIRGQVRLVEPTGSTSAGTSVPLKNIKVIGESTRVPPPSNVVVPVVRVQTFTPVFVTTFPVTTFPFTSVPASTILPISPTLQVPLSSLTVPGPTLTVPVSIPSSGIVPTSTLFIPVQSGLGP